MTKKLAQMISVVFHPHVEIPVLLVLAVVTAYSNGAQTMFLGMLLFVDVLLPLGFYLHLRRTGEISDWDIVKREERLGLYAFTTLAHLGGVMLARGFGQYELMRILLAFWLLALMFAVVTVYWKVSVHAGVNSALATFATIEFGIKWWWLFGIVLLVAWARVKLKRHQIAEVLIGGLLGLLGTMAGMRLVGL